MPAYATQTDFEGYVEGWQTDDAAALDRLLERASRDVDYALGPRAVLQTGTYTGFKLDPALLTVAERAALSRATCAQAEFLVRSDPDGIVRGIGRTRVLGPDFTEFLDGPGTKGGRLAPRLAQELEPLARYRVLTATTGPRRYVPGS